MQYLIGSDVGTSGTKTVLFDETGKIVETAFREYPLYQIKSGWAEQDPRDWAEAVLATVREVLEKSGIAPDKVKGVGLSGQMHGLVLLDKACRVLRKSIIWCDQRTQAECDEITEIVGKERLTEITANPAITGFTASKIRWVQKNEPEIWAKTAHILLPKDYVRFVLTGEFITDVSDASGMQLMDIAGRCYSDEVLEKLHIERRFLPRIVESAECGGRVCAAAAAVCGLKEGTAVAGSAGDQAAAAIGNGIVESGIVSCNIGTSGVVFAHTETPRADAKGRVHTFCHAVRGKWHVMGVTQGAGLSMKWFKDHFLRRTGERDGRHLCDRERRHSVGSRRMRGAFVPAVPDGRAYAPSRRGRERGVFRHHAPPHAGAFRARGHGGSEFFPSGLSANLAGNGQFAARDSYRRRRREERAVETDDRRRIRLRDGRHQFRRGGRAGRGDPCGRRRGRLSECGDRLPQHDTHYRTLFARPRKNARISEILSDLLRIVSRFEK